MNLIFQVKGFAKSVAKELGVELGHVDVTRFADGEISVQINESRFALFIYYKWHMS